jgi:SAM-dependent methyltransferase
MPQNTFVGDAARQYDAHLSGMNDPVVIAPIVERLAELTNGGAALEFAIGTGRIALPLRQRGVHVQGIDISEDMIAELRQKPGGAEIAVTIGDMASVRVPGAFSLVYLVFNTISNLLTQSEQTACFCNAAAHLSPGGCFVVELEVPQLRRMPPGENAYPHEIAPHHLGFDTYDFANQRLTSHHYFFEGDRCSRFDSHHRYVWPAELDLMAQIAGMRLAHRWADWRGTPFDGNSQSHVSVWRKTAV